MDFYANFTRCLNAEEQKMHGSDFELFVQRYVLPTLSIFGIVGNCLNLSVLLTMKSRSNTFLSLLAFTDIVFLLLLWPSILANIPVLTYMYEFRYAYYWTKTHMLAITNWSAGVSMWCVIAVCTERLRGILHPLYVRDIWPRWKMPLVLSTIVFVPFLATFYQHFNVECRTALFCNNDTQQIYQRCKSYDEELWFANASNPNPQRKRVFQVLLHMHLSTMIVFPIFVLSVLNFLLFCALRKRRRDINSLHMEASSASLAPRRSTAGLPMKKRASSVSLVVQTEHRVTLTVVLIVTVFTITNLPSAILPIIKSAFGLDKPALYDWLMVCNVLVSCGKASNFILFCLGSKHFRQRLLTTLTHNWQASIFSRSSPSTRHLLILEELKEFVPRPRRSIFFAR